MKKTFSALIIVLILCGCKPDHNQDYNFKYEIIVTDSATNLQSLNSESDDYNSALPYPAARSEIYFSSNRNNGSNFDIISKAIDISYHRKDDVLNFSIPGNVTYSPYQTKLLNLINTLHDELGPFSYLTDELNYFFYADNETGNFDIKFVYTSNSDWGTYNGQERLYGPIRASIINSDSDDLYPTINEDRSKLFFCSNRENSSFDIFSINLNSEALKDFLNSANSVQISKDSVLSSGANDKCPSINGNLMVFASDRDGGYGGFDLYYSQFINNQWSTPVNFGDKINSSSDEYRPITFSFLNNFDLMIFSSNRPGGKGGFDLYCAQINDLIGKE